MDAALVRHPATRKVWRHALFASGLLTLAASASGAQAAPLQAYNVDPASVSVSGLSSGGFMAAQLGIAYSAIFQAGFGVFAGGPFDCARNQNYTSCMYNATPSITTPNANINAWSGNQIDPKANLLNRKIYLWGGTSDTTVGPNVMNRLKSQMDSFGTAANIKYDTTSGAAHTFPTDFAGTGDNACSSAASPYISNCSFDGAGAALKHLYGTLNARNTGTPTGSVVSFDQSAYLSAANGGGATGYVYVPSACSPGGSAVCKLHVALHGCQQSYGKIGDKFIQNTGYNKWADTNNIVILYPQTTVDNTSHSTWSSGSLANPNACWDWIGWYGANADQKGGVQMAALVSMVNKVTSGYNSVPPTAVPSVPAGVAVSGTTASSVTLGWSASSGATSYKIYRGTTNVGTSTSPGYTDSGLTASTSYSYSVSAVNTVGESAKSATVSGTTQAAVTYTQAITATVTTHYVAGRLTVAQYNTMGAKYGYNASMTLYLCGSTWTNSATCGPLS